MKKSNGITLIPLIVSIIILLILAGISIHFLIGNNSVINKMFTSKEVHIIQEIREELNVKLQNIISDNVEKGINNSKLQSLHNFENQGYQIKAVNDKCYLYQERYKFEIREKKNGDQEVVFIAKDSEIKAVAENLVFENQEINTTYSEYEQNKSIIGVTNVSGNFVYTYKENSIPDDADGYIEFDGKKITLKSGTPAGTYEYTVTATDDDLDATTNANLTIKVDKADLPDNVLTLTDPRETYTGSSYYIGVSEVSGGKVQYKTSEDEIHWNNWTEEKPSRVDAGILHVQAYVKGDKNHNDTNTVTGTITVNKASLNWPTQKEIITYDGDVKSPEWNNYDFRKMKLEDTTGVNAGTYIAKFTLKDNNYKWKDKSADIDELEVSWTIGKADGSITLSASTGTITYGTLSKEFTVLTNHGGTLTVSLTVSDDNTTVGSAISGTKITLSNLGSINAGTTIKVTVTCAETTNYKEATATYTLTVNEEEAVGPWTQNKTQVTSKDGKITLQVGSAVTGYSVTVGNKTYGDNKWYVLGAEDGKLLITTNENVENLYLNGANGYINGVSNLNNVAKKYTNSDYLDKSTYARSINAEDIERIKGVTKETRKNYSAGSGLKAYGANVKYSLRNSKIQVLLSGWNGNNRYNSGFSTFYYVNGGSMNAVGYDWVTVPTTYYKVSVSNAILSSSFWLATPGVYTVGDLSASETPGQVNYCMRKI